MRPALEYASSVWSSIASSTSINKLQVMQNAALKTATGCTQTQTYNICMTKHSHSPYTSTYSSTPHNTNRKHNIHHIPYTNTLQCFTAHISQDVHVWSSAQTRFYDIMFFRPTLNVSFRKHTFITTDTYV